MTDGCAQHVLSFGKPRMGRVRGGLLLAARWGTLPVGLALCCGCTYVGVTTGATWVFAGVYLGAPLAFFGLFAVVAGSVWRSRGRALQGVSFRVGGGEPDLVQLDFPVRTRMRPLSELEAIEVHAMTEWVDLYDTDTRNRDTPPWLRLRFRAPSRRQPQWYCLTPILLGGAPASELLSRLLAGTQVTIVDVRRRDRARAGLPADRVR